MVSKSWDRCRVVGHTVKLEGKDVPTVFAKWTEMAERSGFVAVWRRAGRCLNGRFRIRRRSRMVAVRVVLAECGMVGWQCDTFCDVGDSADDNIFGADGLN